MSVMFVALLLYYFLKKNAIEYLFEETN